MKAMFSIGHLKALISSEISLGLILIGKILAAIDMHALSIATSIAGLIVALLTSISLIIRIRKDWRETPEKDSKMKRFFKSKNKKQ